jgi:hypothetical protein
LPKSPFDDHEIKIIRCPYCGYESHKDARLDAQPHEASMRWLRRESLNKKKLRKALDAVAKAFDDLRRQFGE